MSGEIRATNTSPVLLYRDNNLVHVVEHSAYQTALDEIEKLRSENERLSHKADDEVVAKARQLYGPAGFRHVSNMLDEIKSLKAELERAKETSEVRRLHLYEATKEASRLSLLSESERAKSAEYREVLEGLLSTIALDWYVEQFAKSTKPTETTSGIVAHVHNQHLYTRMKIALEKARAALANTEGVSNVSIET